MSPEVRISKWTPEFIETLPSIASNKNIWNNLCDVFPHPYTAQDAKEWWEIVCKKKHSPPAEHFAICVAQGDTLTLIGGCSVSTEGNPNQRHVGTIGYWLGEPFWGKGYGTKAVKLLVERSLSKEFASEINEGHQILRLQACVFEYNKISARVLEKCGFTLESVQKNVWIKNGKVINGLLYVIHK
eukprot:TRINITY_DN9716_c0_g1_i1.p1 TRINITY_DN9716_c0_g1~~TRINITY_DN9716_c0_g1_i1.p1  ORF type:complete len:185 (-),score=23.43 TRINITY_DN9716_c0_g1_i1:10-564(-)